jgi:hypothetical protein
MPEMPLDWQAQGGAAFLLVEEEREFSTPARQLLATSQTITRSENAIHPKSDNLLLVNRDRT